MERWTGELRDQKERWSKGMEHDVARADGEKSQARVCGRPVTVTGVAKVQYSR